MTDADSLSLPEAGDLVWADLRPTLGREQTGVRPVIVLTNREFYARNATAIVCPITRNVAPWPTKVILPVGLPVEGVILADPVRSIDRSTRGFRRIGRVPDDTLDAVRRKIANVIGLSLVLD